MSGDLVLRENTPADSLARFENEYIETGVLKVNCRLKTRQSGSNDDDVRILRRRTAGSQGKCRCDGKSGDCFAELLQRFSASEHILWALHTNRLGAETLISSIDIMLL